jgi:hypothetical protein
MADTDAIRINSKHDEDRELARLVIMVARTLKVAKKENRPVFVLPNYKFTTEEGAIAFSALVPAALEVATKETWFVSRMMTGIEGHLMMGLGCLMPQEKFEEAMAHLDEAKACDVCGKEGELHKCGGCGRTRYCGKDCQKSDWKNHKEICKKTSEEYKKWKLNVS